MPSQVTDIITRLYKLVCIVDNLIDDSAVDYSNAQHHCSHSCWPCIVPVFAAVIISNSVAVYPV